MLTWILIIALALAGLLLIPIRLVFQGVWPGGKDNELVLYWFFGLLHLRLGGRRRKKVRKPRKKRNWLAALKDTEWTQRVIRFITELWEVLETEDLQVTLRAGLGSKAETGLLWLVLGPVATVLGSRPDTAISVEPDFRRKTLELDGRGNLRAVPLRVLGLCLGLWVSPVFRRGIRKMRNQE
ncbi:MAG: DUF2953 domain-containing protein [Xanthomonadales bacterium]|nr:DUF2953 domain-containing protein [Xanthomonadales bacterium]